MSDNSFVKALMRNFKRADQNASQFQAEIKALTRKDATQLAEWMGSDAPPTAIKFAGE